MTSQTYYCIHCKYQFPIPSPNNTHCPKCGNDVATQREKILDAVFSSNLTPDWVCKCGQGNWQPSIKCFNCGKVKSSTTQPWHKAAAEEIRKIVHYDNGEYQNQVEQILSSHSTEANREDTEMLDWCESKNENWHDIVNTLLDRSKLGGYNIRAAIKAAMEK